MVRRFVRMMGASAALVLGAGGVAFAKSADEDPRLNQPLSLETCIAIALDYNLELQAARLRYQSSRAGVGAALGIYWPDFFVTATGSNFNLAGQPFLLQSTQAQFQDYRDRHDLDQWIRGGTASMAERLPLGSIIGINYTLNHMKIEPDRHDEPNFEFDALFTQPLLRGGGWLAGTGEVKTANLDADIAAEEVHAREQFVTANTKIAFYDGMRALRLVQVNEQAVSRDSQLVALSQSKLDTGLGTKRDVLSAQIQLEQDRGTLVDAQTAFEEALDSLRRALGLRLDDRRLTFVPTPMTHTPIPIDEDAWTAKARKDNPDILASRRVVDRDRHLMKVARNAALPQLDLNFGWRQANDPDANELRQEENAIRAALGDSLKTYRTTGFKGWTGGVVLNIPLGNKILGNRAKQAEFTYEQSQKLAQEVEYRVTNEVRTAVRALQNNVDRLAILEKSIEGARSKLEFANVNFQLGRASNLDITDAQKDLVDAETDYTNEVIDYKIQVARIEQLLSGF